VHQTANQEGFLDPWFSIQPHHAALDQVNNMAASIHADANGSMFWF